MSEFADIDGDRSVFIAKLALDRVLQSIRDGRRAGAEISLMRDVGTDTVRFELTGPAMTRDEVNDMIAAWADGNWPLSVLPGRFLHE